MTTARPSNRLLKADRIHWFRAVCHSIEAYPHMKRIDNTLPEEWRNWSMRYTVVTFAGAADIDVAMHGWSPFVMFTFDDPARAGRIVEAIRNNSADLRGVDPVTGRWLRSAGLTKDSAAMALVDFLNDLRELMPVVPNARAKAAKLALDYDTAMASIQECMVERAAKAAFRASMSDAKESRA